MTVRGSIFLPGLKTQQTRGGLGETPGENLKLTLIEFDKGATPEETFLANSYQAKITSKTTAVNNGDIVNFEVTLLSANEPKVLHLVVADDYVTPEYGSEAKVLSSLKVGQKLNENGELEGTISEAYWGREEFPNGFSRMEKQTNESGEEIEVPVLLDEVTEKLTKVPVIRNFAEVTMSVELKDNKNNFKLNGFRIVNVPLAGTVGPYSIEKQQIPTLLSNKAMLPYLTVSQYYNGIVAPSTPFGNTETQAKSWTANDFNTDSKFLYERPYQKNNRTYIIVYGDYTNSDNETIPGFYKLDIGNLNDAGNFDYYDLIRNYRFNIKITEVTARGTTTVKEAIDRAPFNNLISATETSTALNVSDGKNMLIVNATNHIIVDNQQPIEVLYRYIVDVTGNKTPDNSVPQVDGLYSTDYATTKNPAVVDGAVVAQATLPKDTVINNVHWMKIVLYPKEPGSESAEQKFTIVDNNGLGRIITLNLQLPWKYEPIVVDDETYPATIANGKDNLYQGAPQLISPLAGQELTVYFNLPDGMPESVFPLDFTLESLKQGIENNKVGTLSVTYGNSLFESKKGQVAIQYVKTLTYNEYMYEYTDDDSNDVNINKRNEKHTVRCRFLTISSSAGDAEGKIIIHNPYFTPDVTVDFKRGTVSTE